jgi:3-oxoadipate enol-lactonase
MLLSHNNHRLYFDLAGPQNAPVVCFTHSLAADGGMWNEQLVPLLAAGYRVLRLDMRGHGGSEPVAGDYTMDALADDVKGALDMLGIGRVHFIGLSIGGMIGQGFALAHPDRLHSLMLCDTHPSSPDDSAGLWDQRKAAVAKGHVAALADGNMERWFTAEFKGANPQRFKEIHSTICGTSDAGFLGCAAAIQNFDYLARLPTIRTPTLVVCGDEDGATPPDRNRLIAAKIPGARYEGIARARHLPNVERPEQFTPIMMQWLGLNR